VKQAATFFGRARAAVFRGSRLLPAAALAIFLLAGPAGAASLDKALKLDSDGFHEDAAAEWKSIIDSGPEPALLLFSHLKLSSAYMKIAELGLAVDAAKAAATLAPGDYDAQFHLANSLSRTGDHQAASAAFKQTVKIRPDEGLGYVGLALNQFAEGDRKAAITTLEEAKVVFKKKRNIQWYQDSRIMIQQIKDFAKYPKNFADLWLKNNLSLVRETYEKTVFSGDGPQ